METTRKKERERTAYKGNREKRLQLHIRESNWKYFYLLTERVNRKGRTCTV